MKVVLGIGCVLGLASLAVVADVKLTEDAPVTGLARRGDITGIITPADKVAEVYVVFREPNAVYPASFDKASGKFVAHNLPGDTSYDVCIKTTDGRRIEGIDLRFVSARLLALGEQRRKDLKLPPGLQHRFVQDDANALIEYCATLKAFEDLHRVLYIGAHGRTATMLVENMRTVPYVNAKDTEVIWRIELWYFQWNWGGWERVNNTERVLIRERVLMDKWQAMDVEYYPELSIPVLHDGSSKKVEFRIPDKPDPTRGRPRNTPPDLKTDPHIIGLEANPEDASTQPAK